MISLLSQPVLEIKFTSTQVHLGSIVGRVGTCHLLICFQSLNKNEDMLYKIFRNQGQLIA